MYKRQILYGEQPSADTVLPGLVPALRLRAAVSMVKELAAGDAVSYGCTFRAPKPMRAATLAVGYALSLIHIFGCGCS